MYFLPGLWKEETTIFMTNNSKIKYEQRRALSLPAQRINQKGSESLQNSNVYVDKFIYQQKCTYHPQRRKSKNLTRIKSSTAFVPYHTL